ncbi:MAG: dTMP kinase [Parachlamydiales bacterium]|nr:dTMP kinase [Parachlamydiales bacterium]
MAGVFLTFEGGEACGKTTLIQGVFKELENRNLPVLSVREPGGTHLGENIRKTLLSTKEHIIPMAELCLFLAARAQHIHEVIRPAMDENKVILCDRFNDSTIAYQGFGRRLGPKEVAHFCNYISSGLTPHLTLYLDIAPEEAFKRVSTRKQDRIELESMEFHRRIREGYFSMAAQEPNRLHIIDATKTPQEVLEDALAHINEVLLLYGMG